MLILAMSHFFKEYNIILDGLENHLTSNGPDTMTMDVLHEKFNHWYEKIKKQN